MTIRQETKEKLTDDKPLEETICSVQKSIKPLVEVISDSSTMFKDSEQVLEQKTIERESRDFKDVSDYHPGDVNT